MLASSVSATSQEQGKEERKKKKTHRDSRDWVPKLLRRLDEDVVGLVVLEVLI